ncbi:MAG: aldo/keto reductase [Lachnospiraceae bacterium]|jgi:diketogulonate reductase-like aldo/keto reductase
MNPMIQVKNDLFPGFGLGTTVFWNGSPEAERAYASVIESGLVELIDCAEMYGDGRCEEAVGRILRKTGRDGIFLVDKILPDNAVPGQFMKSLKRSLRRVGTDHFDLYLLHWREKADLPFVIDQMREAQKQGLILRWGVSNFDVKDMEDLFACEGGEECAADQVMYNLATRGIEYDLLPWLKAHGVLPMSYSTLGSSLLDTHRAVSENSTVKRICAELGIGPSALMLAFAQRNHDICTLFSSRSEQHIRQNLMGAETDLSFVMKELDGEFPPPDKKIPLAKL